MRLCMLAFRREEMYTHKKATEDLVASEVAEYSERVRSNKDSSSL